MARRSPPLDIEETTTGKDYDMPLDDAVNRYHQASQNALGRIFDQEQLTPPDTRPRWSSGQYFDGRLPANWAGLDSRQIGELFEMLTGYADFLGTKVTLAKAERTNSEERLKLVKAKVRRAKTGNNDDKDDATLCDSRYIEANAQWLEASEFYEILNGMLEAASRDLRILSRHLETKKMEFEGGRRMNNLGAGRNPFAR